jgi:hypothetical protein
MKLQEKFERRATPLIACWLDTRMAAGAPIASGLCFAAYGMQVRAQRNLHLGSYIDPSDLTVTAIPLMGSPTHSRSRPLLHLCGAEICFHVAGDDSSVAANLTEFSKQR